MTITTNIKHDGAQCTVTITVPCTQLTTLFSARLSEISRKAKIAGFRPGKAPADLMRRRHGPAVFAEVLRDVIEENADKTLEDNKLRPAQRPLLDVPGDTYDLVALDAGRDFVFTLNFEPLPYIELADLKAMTFERLVAEPNQEDINNALSNLAKSKAEEGAEPPAVDEAFVKSLGVESLETLQEEVKKRLTEELANGAHTRLKMHVMDALDAAHSFEAPPSLIEKEYASILEQDKKHAEHDHDHEHDHHHDHDHKEEDSQNKEAEYRPIAARRVRLALILAEIAKQKNIAVSNDELGRAVGERARMFPGHEEAIFNMMVKNERLLDSIRASVLEDKTIDFVLELATVTQRTVTSKEIFEDESDKKIEKEEEPKTKEKSKKEDKESK